MKKILIIEDEQLASARLEKALHNYYDELEVHCLQSIVEAVAYLKAGQPDLILSDIELLDGKAFKIYESVEVKSPIIFTTAYDQYLLDAFQTTGIAYLLKPIQEKDLHQALDKYEKLFSSNNEQHLDQATLQALKKAIDQPKPSYKRRFTIKKAQGVVLLKTEQISYFYADDNIVFAVDAQQKKHVINHRLSELEDLLDPRMFFRINRSEVINIEYISKIEPYFNHRLSILLKGASKGLVTSGAKTAPFRKWVEEGL